MGVTISHPVIIFSLKLVFCCLFWNTSLFSPLSQHHNCASTSLLVCAESQVEAKIKNDYKQMYLYRSILKKKLKYDEVECEFFTENWIF